MSVAPREFVYAVPHRVRGARPGAHAGLSSGPGADFAGHQRLFEHPDPRRLDLRASLRQPGGQWLVRLSRQRSSMVVRVLVDASASMGFGAPVSKLARAAEFVEALGLSAWRVGDAVELRAFDSVAREDLGHGPSYARGSAAWMARRLREHVPDAGGSHGAIASTAAWAGRHGLVFIVSDFRWPLAQVVTVLDRLASATVVPVIVSDPAESRLPESDGLMDVMDAESGRVRTLWLRRPLRERWRRAEAEREAALSELLQRRHLRPFRMPGAFDAEAMSRHFLEGRA